MATLADHRPANSSYTDSLFVRDVRVLPTGQILVSGTDQRGKIHPDLPLKPYQQPFYIPKAGDVVSIANDSGGRHVEGKLVSRESISSLSAQPGDTILGGSGRTIIEGDDVIINNRKIQGELTQQGGKNSIPDSGFLSTSTRWTLTNGVSNTIVRQNSGIADDGSLMMTFNTLNDPVTADSKNYVPVRSGVHTISMWLSEQVKTDYIDYSIQLEVWLYTQNMNTFVLTQLGTAGQPYLVQSLNDASEEYNRLINGDYATMDAIRVYGDLEIPVFTVASTDRLVAQFRVKAAGNYHRVLDVGYVDGFNWNTIGNAIATGSSMIVRGSMMSLEDYTNFTADLYFTYTTINGKRGIAFAADAEHKIYWVMEHQNGRLYIRKYEMVG